MFFPFLLSGYSTPHDRNENSSPPNNTMIPPQPGGQQYMPMQMQRNSGSAHSVAYHLQNMKEEPSSGANSYANMGSTQDDMPVK